MVPSVFCVAGGFSLVYLSMEIHNEYGPAYEKSVHETVHAIKETNTLIEDLKNQQQTFPELSGVTHESIHGMRESISQTIQFQSDMMSQTTESAKTLRKSTSAIRIASQEAAEILPKLQESLKSIKKNLNQNDVLDTAVSIANQLGPVADTLEKVGQMAKSVSNSTAQFPGDSWKSVRDLLYEIDSTLAGVSRVLRQVEKTLNEEVSRFRRDRKIYLGFIECIDRFANGLHKIFATTIPEIADQLDNSSRILEKGAPQIKQSNENTLRTFDEALEELDHQVSVFENGALKQAPETLEAVETQLRSVVDLLLPASQLLTKASWIIGILGLVTIGGGLIPLVTIPTQKEN